MNIKWDADKYTSDFSFIPQYGIDVMELINVSEINDANDISGISNGISVLDLGCGNGSLTKVMHDKGFSVKGMDASGELLDIARKTYPDIEFIQADATDFALKKPVDVVFSNAVFHWIDQEKQADMLKCVYRALKENGQFVFEFGGYGNNRLIHLQLEKIFVEYGYQYEMPFYFPTIGEYSNLLEQAGFVVKYAILFDRPTKLSGKNGLKDWIYMFVKKPFIGMDDSVGEAIIDKAVDNLQNHLYQEGTWYSDYVRIRMKAVKHC